MRRVIIFIAIGAISVSMLSSCLKDTPFMVLSNTEPVIEFGQSLANGIGVGSPYPTAFGYGPDTANSNLPVTDTAIALVLASPQVLNDTVVVTVAVDPTQITPFNNVLGTQDSLLTSGMYTLPTTTVTILPGYRVGRLPVTLNFPAMPVPHTYALPITIVNAVDINNPQNLILVSSNSGKFMWLFNE